jgi:hypothetical protein
MFNFAHNWQKKPGSPTMTPADSVLCFGLSKIGYFRGARPLHYVVVKTKELTPEQMLSVPCTTCGAAIGEACELNTGALRTAPQGSETFRCRSCGNKRNKRFEINGWRLVPIEKTA